MLKKLENPIRLAELSPQETLAKLGLNQQKTFADIGAGTGIFSFAAVNFTNKPVYAIDISHEAIEYISNKKAILNTENLIPLYEIDSIPENSVDIALMCTVLHELDDKNSTLSNVYKTLNNNGMFAVIDFHKRKTPFGPPPEHRISQKDTVNILTQNGFNILKSDVLGENFYIVVGEKMI